MSKKKTIYVCNDCGGESPKWQGQCPHCASWNSLVETLGTDSQTAGHRFAGLVAARGVLPLASVEPMELKRSGSGLKEFDRVLGGGFVPGGVVLIGGDPGIGKSTLLLQALHQMGQSAKVLYVTGEESPEQVSSRAQRLRVNGAHIHLLPEIQLETILDTLKTEQPAIAVIDSIQTLWSSALTSAPGSVAQVRECAAQLTRLAKGQGTALVMVGHVTKEGNIAGPRVLEHIVDTVLYFEGDSGSSFRLIRAIKNRFGAVNELGVFAMTEMGLKEVSNPSALFLSHSDSSVPGSCITVTQEGSRPLLVEVQALLDTAHAPNPKRLSVGLENSRLAMLLAVLSRHAGVTTYDQDVFINAVAGVRISEPAADLAILLAMVSSLRGKPLPQHWVVFGEVGLAGEIRPVQRGQERLKEAQKLGFTHALIPRANLARQRIPGMEIRAIDRVHEAVEWLRETS